MIHGESLGMSVVTPEVHWFFPGMSFRGDASPKKGAVRKPDESAATDGDGFKTKMLCAACRTLITYWEAGLKVRGRFDHTFCNPHGLVFHIGCFSCAPGCRQMGPSSSDFTWFPGFHWRIVCCRNCQTHLGWLFQGARGGQFFGLILDRLIQVTEGDEP